MTRDNQNLDNHPVAETGSIDEQVPIIDIADLIQDSSSEAARAAIKDIAQACQNWGFFQVINHGIDTILIENVWDQTRAMFALPSEEKMSILRSKDNPWGFYPNELTKNQRDKKEVFDFTREGVDPIYGQSNRWLANQETFKSTMQEYFDACTGLSLTLLEAFCIGLDLPPDHMRGDFANNHTGFMRLNYYPLEDPMAGLDMEHQPVADLGIHHHTDAGALTVLLQDDVGGLQIRHDGKWIPVDPVPGTVVVNTGDIVQVWSNDQYTAPLHRVVASRGRDRYSLPYFFNPRYSCDYSPVPGLLSEPEKARYSPINWGHFRRERQHGDYGNYGEEIQISDFRI